MVGRLPVSVIVVTYQAEEFISATLTALIDDPSGPSEILVVDNGSTDRTGEIVRDFGVRWHPAGRNLGYGAAANEGVRLVSEDVVAVVNHDVIVRPGWLGPLYAMLEAPDVGAVMPTIELTDRPGFFNTSGGHMTVSGVAWITDFGERTDKAAELAVVPFPSGAAFAMRRSTWDRIGGMRSDFFLYHEDTDLGWRLRIHGLKTLRVPGSTVAHVYEFDRNPQKLRLLERNRWLMLATNYRRSTLLLLLPVLVLHETGILIVATRDGWVRGKVATWREVLERRRYLKEQYRNIQRSRTVGDCVILQGATHPFVSLRVPGIEVPRGAALVARITKWYVMLITGVVRAVDRRKGLATRVSA